jgi:hypothetical protein
MKQIESESLIYTQKNIVVGDRKRNVITIDKKPGAQLGQKVVDNKVVTVKKRKCSGCSRRRKG